MKLTHIMQVVYCEPWLITSEMHHQISQILQAHISGDAHKAGGIADLFDQQDEVMPEMFGDVALIPIKGVIGRGVSQLQKSSGVVDVRDIETMIEWASEAEEVRSVILDIDSPGGTVTGVPELAQKIADLNQIKKVRSFTSGMAASAAYWLGSQAYAFYATPSATVGSIGVYMPVLDSSRKYEMQGLKMEVIKAGKYKGAGVPGTALNSDQREMIQEHVDQIHGMFRAAVVAARGPVNSDHLEGQDMFAAQAVQANLIDGVMSLKDVIKDAQASK